MRSDARTRRREAFLLSQGRFGQHKLVSPLQYNSRTAGLCRAVTDQAALLFLCLTFLLGAALWNHNVARRILWQPLAQRLACPDP